MPYLGRTPAGAAGNKITGDLKVTGVLSADGIHNNILLNSTDGSANENDNVVMDGTDSDSTNADDNLLYEEYTQDLISLTNLASGTDGNIISYDTAGLPVAIATGSDGQVLTSAGAGAPPAFEAAGGGGWVFVEKVTASTSSTIELGEGNIDSGYDYIILCRNVDNSADFNTNNGPRIQFGTGGTPSYQTSGYKNQSLRAEGTGTTVTRDDITAGISIASPNTLGGAGAGEIWSSESIIPNAATSVIHQCISTLVAFSSVAEPITAWNGGYRTTADAITGLKIFPASGTFVSGDFILCKRAMA